MRTSILPVAFLLPASIAAQPVGRDTLLARMHALEVVCAHADTLTIDEVVADDWNINWEIGDHLVRLLETPGLTNHDLDSLVSAGIIHGVRSEDGRLWIFNWSGRTGGTFQAESSVVFHRMPGGEGRASHHSELDEDGWGSGAGYYQIHQLRSANGASLYVCLGQVIGCATCCTEVADVLELTDEGINHEYPAFVSPAGKNDDGPKELGSTFSLNMRCDDRSQFTYDPRRRAFTYAYMTDDLTPVPLLDGEESRKVTGTIRFNGEQFVVE